MAKLTDLTQKYSVDAADVIHFVDVSDTTQDAAGSSYKVRKQELLADYAKTDTNTYFHNGTAQTNIGAKRTVGGVDAITYLNVDAAGESFIGRHDGISANRGVQITNNGVNYYDGTSMVPIVLSTDLVAQTYLNVKDYGVVGDGIVMDTIAFRAAITAAAALNNAVIYIPPSTNILVDDSILLPSNTTIKGGNKYTSKVTASILSPNTIKVLRNADFTLGNSNIELSNFTVDGLNISNSVCVELQRVTNPVLNDMYITRGGIEGVYLYLSYNAIISNFHAYFNGDYRVDASGLHLDSCEYFSINGCISHNNGFHGLILTGGGYGIVEGLVAYGNGYQGFFTQFNTSDVTVSLNVYNNFRGVYMLDATNMHISGIARANTNNLLTRDSTNVVFDVISTLAVENDLYLVGTTDNVYWTGLPLSPITAIETTGVVNYSNGFLSNSQSTYVDGGTEYRTLGVKRTVAAVDHTTYLNTVSDGSGFMGNFDGTTEVGIRIDEGIFTFQDASGTKNVLLEGNPLTGILSSTLTGEPIGSDVILNTVSLTQAEYDAGTIAGTINATTMYNITTI